MLSPAVFFNLIVGLIGALRVFTAAYVATGGGPSYSTTFYMLYLFNNAFKFLYMGFASALAWMFVLLALVLVIIQSGWRVTGSTMKERRSGERFTIRPDLRSSPGDDRRIPAWSLPTRIHSWLLIEDRGVRARHRLRPHLRESVPVRADRLADVARRVVRHPTALAPEQDPLEQLCPGVDDRSVSTVHSEHVVHHRACHGRSDRIVFARGVWVRAIPFPGRNALFIILLGTMIMPSEVTTIPQFLLFKDLGWINTYLPLIVPNYFGVSAFTIFLLRQFFLTLPRDLDDAARIDGASSLRILLQLLLPLSKPALATVAILSFIYHWNDFFTPLIYLSNEDYLHRLARTQFLQIRAN